MAIRHRTTIESLSAQSRMYFFANKFIFLPTLFLNSPTPQNLHKTLLANVNDIYFGGKH